MDIVLLVILVGIFLVGVFFWASAIGAQAQNKGRSFTAFFWLSFLFSPLIMQIIVASLADSGNQPTASNNESATQKISELKALLDSGAITQTEFDDKKKKYLDQI